MKAIFFVSFSLMLSGCVTEFRGEPHVDRPYCENFCRKNDLTFSGMVALGEYSSGCVCSAKGAGTSHAEVGMGGAAAAVISAMRQRQQDSANASMMSNAVHYP